jgi:hypothetical protein
VDDVSPPAGRQFWVDYSTTLQNAPTVVRFGRNVMPRARPLLML